MRKSVSKTVLYGYVCEKTSWEHQNLLSTFAFDRFVQVELSPHQNFFFYIFNCWKAARDIFGDVVAAALSLDGSPFSGKSSFCCLRTWFFCSSTTIWEKDGRTFTFSWQDRVRKRCSSTVIAQFIPLAAATCNFFALFLRASGPWWSAVTSNGFFWNYNNCVVSSYYFVDCCTCPPVPLFFFLTFFGHGYNEVSPFL